MGDLVEANLQIVKQVLASGGSICAFEVLEAPEPAENPFYEAAEPAPECAESHVSEYGVEVRAPENVFSVIFLVDSLSPELVVLFPLLFIGQYCVGFRDFLELLSGLRSFVPVRMIL